MALNPRTDGFESSKSTWSLASGLHTIPSARMLRLTDAHCTRPGKRRNFPPDLPSLRQHLAVCDLSSPGSAGYPGVRCTAHTHAQASLGQSAPSPRGSSDPSTVPAGKASHFFFVQGLLSCGFMLAHNQIPGSAIPEPVLLSISAC